MDFPERGYSGISRTASGGSGESGGLQSENRWGSATRDLINKVRPKWLTKRNTGNSVIDERENSGNLPMGGEQVARGREDDRVVQAEKKNRDLERMVTQLKSEVTRLKQQADHAGGHGNDPLAALKREKPGNPTSPLLGRGNNHQGEERQPSGGRPVGAVSPFEKAIRGLQAEARQNSAASDMQMGGRQNSHQSNISGRSHSSGMSQNVPGIRATSGELGASAGMSTQFREGPPPSPFGGPTNLTGGSPLPSGGRFTGGGEELMGGTGIMSPFGGGEMGGTEFLGGEIGNKPIASPFDLDPAAAASPFGGNSNPAAAAGEELFGEPPPASPWGAPAAPPPVTGADVSSGTQDYGMEIGYAPIVSPWDTASSTTDSSAIQGMSLTTLTTPSSGELGDHTNIAGTGRELPAVIGEELASRPSLKSPFDPEGGRSSSFTAGRSNTYPPALSTVAEETLSQQATGTSALSSPGASYANLSGHEELNPRPSLVSPFGGDSGNDSSAGGAMVAELNSRPSLRSPWESASQSESNQTPISPLANRPRTPSPTRQARPASRMAVSSGSPLGEELSARPSLTSPWESSTGTGSTQASDVSQGQSSGVLGSIRLNPVSNVPSPFADGQIKEGKVTAPEAAGSELNSRTSLPSPFDANPSSGDDSSRQGAESAGSMSHRGIDAAGPSESGELNSRPSLVSPFESNSHAKPPRPRSIDSSKRSFQGGDSEISKVASFDDWKHEGEASDPNFKAVGSTDLNPRPSLRSPFEKEKAKDSVAAATSGELNTRQSLPSPFQGGRESEAAPEESAAHDKEQAEHATKKAETHAAVHASFEAPIMTAAMSPTPAPTSPFGDSSMPDESAAAPMMMSASLGVATAIASPFGSPDEEEQAEPMSASMASGAAIRSPFDDEPTEASHQNKSGALGSLGSRMSFLPEVNSGQDEKNKQQSFLWTRDPNATSPSTTPAVSPTVGKAAAAKAAAAQDQAMASATSARSQSLQIGGLPRPQLHPRSPTAAAGLDDSHSVTFGTSAVPSSAFEDAAVMKFSEAGPPHPGSVAMRQQGSDPVLMGAGSMVSTVSRKSDQSRHPSEFDGNAAMGGDTMVMMEAFAKLQKENVRLQNKVMRMEDASGRVAELEDLNRRLSEDREKLKRKGEKSRSVSLFQNDKTLSKALAEAKQEVSTLQMELEACVAENDQLTLDNLKLINHLEEMSKAFGVDLNEDPEGYLTGGESRSVQTESGDLSGYDARS
ncbi:hypothetical protein WJX73_009142 [Symbiochloris irregularis]|uniref:Uncharacterized protein n=1 Tax=Symbiochloris irregularis TaxID=706552 RepID=A0AAW1PIN4_9CHLO